ncbi:hypothetical protein IDH44_19430 [Paenibacillus sp. IB182496]|uniref:Sporulation lipoprotein YhcN/YlaJ n=2 Tax=Paenibacillus sabuli TaxID=2772509 RepID=A0A927GT26_9BACL|nr:hypothetical protein [Paenibacillus sabuli]
MLLAGVVALSCIGCNYKQHVQESEHDYGSQDAGDPKLYGGRQYGALTGRTNQHDNRYFEYSSLLSRETARIDGLATSVVMLTDKNAYVGIALDWTAVGTKRKGGFAMREQNNTGTTEGVYNFRTGSPYYNNRKAITPFNSPFSVQDHNLISGELKQTIAKRIRKLAPQVEEIHISAKRDFTNEMVDYAKEAWLGHPLQPYLNNFNTMVKYEFAAGQTLPEPVERLVKQGRQAKTK